MKRNKPERLYTTSEVALIVDAPVWRVKNFAQRAYDLPPTQLLGSGGRGSRRVYSLVDLLRVAVANELLTCGCGPEAVGKGLHKIPESLLTKWATPEEKDWKARPMLVSLRGEWRLIKASELGEILQTMVFILDAPEAREWYGFVVLDVSAVLDDTWGRLTDLESEGKIRV